MDNEVARRVMLKKGLALSSLAAITSASWPLPALAQGEEMVRFTDVKGPIRTDPAEPGKMHVLDTRTIRMFLSFPWNCF